MIERDIKIKSDNWKVELNEIWNQAYTWLGKAILFIRHSELKCDDKIKNYSEIKANFSQDYKVPETFTQFKIGQFIAIYELVEMKVFPKVVKLVEMEYKIELPDNKEAKKEVAKFIKTFKDKFDFAKRFPSKLWNSAYEYFSNKS